MLNNLLSLTLFLLVTSGSLMAAPVLWTLSGVTFSNGTTAVGSFVYDVDTNILSAVDITTSDGTHYITPHNGLTHSASEANFLTAASGDLTGTRVMALFPTPAFSNTLGARNLVGNVFGEGTCTNATCTALTGFSSATAGTLIGAAGPFPLRFVPIAPCRIADTRAAAGPSGGPALVAGGSRSFDIPASNCGVPVDAQAYSFNAAVVPSGPLGYLTLWPTGQTRPLTSNVNSVDGRVKSNAAIVAAGTGGAVSVFASDATHVILDLNGYFVPAANPAALAFFPITPCRIADTRTAAGGLGGPSLGAGQTRTFPILTSTCNISPTALAYSLNFAAVPGGTPLGFVTAWATGQAKPLASSLNAPTGTVTANAVIVPAGTLGSIDVYASDATNMVIDINGYFAPMVAGGLSLFGTTPCRVVDTRQAPGSPAITTLDVAVSASPCGIPMSAQAHVLGVAAIPPAPMGYLTLWPQGLARPLASTLNALDGVVTSNMAIVPTSNGSVSAFASNPTHLVIDIFGYFGQ